MNIMNCQQCLQNVDAYIEKRLPENKIAEVKKHLEVCSACSELVFFGEIAEKVITEEKALNVNPYLAVRVMTQINISKLSEKGYKSIGSFTGILRPFLVAASITVAVFLGIIGGNNYQPKSSSNDIPEEMVYINDANLESLDLLINE